MKMGVTESLIGRGSIGLESELNEMHLCNIPGAENESILVKH